MPTEKKISDVSLKWPNFLPSPVSSLSALSSHHSAGYIIFYSPFGWRKKNNNFLFGHQFRIVIEPGKFMMMLVFLSLKFSWMLR
jgi:hypothetical protein